MLARPWKHPKSAVDWLCKSVPDHLRKRVGYREAMRGLQTRDPDDAKRPDAAALGLGSAGSLV
jgi:hypothetical protein